APRQLPRWSAGWVSLGSGAMSLHLRQQLVGGQKERILLQHPADDVHRMGPDDVDQPPAAKLGGGEYSNHPVRIFHYDAADPCFVLEKFVRAGATLENRTRVKDDPREREALRLSPLERLFDERNDAILIEPSLAQM